MCDFRPRLIGLFRRTKFLTFSSAFSDELKWSIMLIGWWVYRWNRCLRYVAFSTQDRSKIAVCEIFACNAMRWRSDPPFTAPVIRVICSWRPQICSDEGGNASAVCKQRSRSPEPGRRTRLFRNDRMIHTSLKNTPGLARGWLSGALMGSQSVPATAPLGCV
mmetsp:Transcript_4369/g.12390  ORF Transcript_4369/g.12390 Transcript_4369/m.12390 type:complete len:162 (-) Transcript_4369:14-499(-)